jgi:hypothetical protein
MTESTGELFARITNTMVIIKESFPAYANTIEAPQHDVNGGYFSTKWKNDSINNAMQFFIMQLFQAALAGDIHKDVSQHDQNTITLDDIYQVATNTQREASSKITKTDAAKESYDTENEEDEVAAFQNQKNTRFPNKSKKPNSVTQARNRQFQ